MSSFIFILALCGIANKLMQTDPAFSKDDPYNLSWPDIVAEYKLLLVGDSGVGKTTFVKKHLTDKFEHQHIPTRGVEVSSITFSTNYGLIKFNIWDIAGLENLRKLKEGYYVGGDCAMITFDVTSSRSAKNVPRWYKDVIRICPGIPVIVIGNKVEKRNRKFKARHMTYMRQNKLQYYDYSNMTGYQFQKPFLYMMKRLVNDAKLDYMPIEVKGELVGDNKWILRICYLILILSVVFVIVGACVFLKRKIWK